MTNDITVILNSYKRPHTAAEQVQAIYNQKDVLVREIFYVQNTMPGIVYDERIKKSPGVTSFEMNRNIGVWGRFYAALNARTDWVCILDDDTIPGDLWLKNCLDTQKNYPGLHCGIGIRFPRKKYEFKMRDRIGWDNPNEQVEQVDLGGHCWNFHRDLLSIFCRELPPIDHDVICGEDIHFSAMLQKYTNLKTYVPPHPINNKRMWSSYDKKKAWEIGGDRNATAGFAVPLFQKAFDKYLENGFRLMCER